MRKSSSAAILALAGPALTMFAASTDAAGVTVTVENDLAAARPQSTIAVPFADIARIDGSLRMFHVVVKDRKGRALPAQITNYQHDHRGAQYDDLVFAYDFAAGEKRAVFTVEPTARPTPPGPTCASARVAPWTSWARITFSSALKSGSRWWN